MTPEHFQNVCVSVWEEYLRVWGGAIDGGQVRFVDAATKQKQVALYPTHALVVETPEHFILELFGASSLRTKLVRKAHEVSSTNTYFGQFDDDPGKPLILFEGTGACVRGGLLARKGGVEAAAARFGSLGEWRTQLVAEFPGGSLVGFESSARCNAVSDCMLVNHRGPLARVKYVLHAWVASKQVTEVELRQTLLAHLAGPNQSETPLGVTFGSTRHAASANLATQFASLFLTAELRETTLGDFLKHNPDYVRIAFGCDGCLYEPSFEWKEGNPDPTEHAINPDLMPYRGPAKVADICDLKTALLERASIVAGERRRRRFVHAVTDGLAQLGNYSDYFRFPQNQAHALERYGVQVVAPRMTLVVGCYENAQPEELREASRVLAPEYSVIDYDTLNSMFWRSLRSTSGSSERQA